MRRFISKIRIFSSSSNVTPIDNYMFKVNNRNTRKQSTKYVQTCSGIFIANFEHISHLALVSLLLTLNS